jgi:hypothetical protein
MASPVTAVIVGALIIVLAEASWPLAGLARQNLAGGGGTLLLVPAFAIVGFLLAIGRPGNPLGWLLLGAAFFLVLSGDASLYAVADYRPHNGRLPLGWVAMLAQPGCAPAIVAFGLAALLFPDGALPSRLWRLVAWAYLTLAALWTVGHS